MEYSLLKMKALLQCRFICCKKKNNNSTNILACSKSATSNLSSIITMGDVSRVFPRQAAAPLEEEYDEPPQYEISKMCAHYKKICQLKKLYAHFEVVYCPEGT